MLLQMPGREHPQPWSTPVAEGHHPEGSPALDPTYQTGTTCLDETQNLHHMSNPNTCNGATGRKLSPTKLLSTCSSATTILGQLSPTFQWEQGQALNSFLPKTLYLLMCSSPKCRAKFSVMQGLKIPAAVSRRCFDVFDKKTSPRFQAGKVSLYIFPSTEDFRVVRILNTST